MLPCRPWVALFRWNVADLSPSVLRPDRCAVSGCGQERALERRTGRRATADLGSPGLASQLANTVELGDPHAVKGRNSGRAGHTAPRVRKGGQDRRRSVVSGTRASALSRPGFFVTSLRSGEWRKLLKEQSHSSPARRAASARQPPDSWRQTGPRWLSRRGEGQARHSRH